MKTLITVFKQHNHPNLLLQQGIVPLRVGVLGKEEKMVGGEVAQEEEACPSSLS